MWSYCCRGQKKFLIERREQTSSFNFDKKIWHHRYSLRFLISCFTSHSPATFCECSVRIVASEVCEDNRRASSSLSDTFSLCCNCKILLSKTDNRLLSGFRWKCKRARAKMQLCKNAFKTPPFHFEFWLRPALWSTGKSVDSAPWPQLTGQTQQLHHQRIWHPTRPLEFEPRDLSRPLEPEEKSICEDSGQYKRLHIQIHWYCCVQIYLSVGGRCVRRCKQHRRSPRRRRHPWTGRWDWSGVRLRKRHRTEHDRPCKNTDCNCMLCKCRVDTLVRVVGKGLSRSSSPKCLGPSEWTSVQDAVTSHDPDKGRSLSWGKGGRMNQDEGRELCVLELFGKVTSNELPTALVRMWTAAEMHSVKK